MYVQDLKKKKKPPPRSLQLLRQSLYSEQRQEYLEVGQ